MQVRPTRHTSEVSVVRGNCLTVLLGDWYWMGKRKEQSNIAIRSGAEQICSIGELDVFAGLKRLCRLFLSMVAQSESLLIH